MDRSDLRQLAEKHGAKTGAALRLYFATEAGRIAIANAPAVQAGGLPRPMTIDEAVAACLEEAAPFIKPTLRVLPPTVRKPAVKKAKPAPKRKK